jgi:hypothetical protein
VYYVVVHDIILTVGASTRLKMSLHLKSLIFYLNMSESRHCKGYLVNCKNPAVKGRLFCFTCAGRKSRNKKTLALETCERDVKELRAKLEDMTAELVSACFISE